MDTPTPAPIYRDPKTGRWTRTPPTPDALPAGAPIITRENAPAMLARREELKRQRIIEAANLAASRALAESRDPAIRALAGSQDAYLAAIAIGRAQAAMDSDNPYGNQAAIWIMRHAGHDVIGQGGDASVTNVIRIILHGDDDRDIVDADSVTVGDDN